MRDFVISTDTTSDLPEDFIQENDIDIHPLTYTFGEEIFGIEQKMSEKDFYARMRGGEMPTTMACNPEQSQEFFEKRVQSGVDVLHIAFSSDLSSTYNNAWIAGKEVMEQYPDSKIIVIDSLSASMGEGLMVYYAVRLKKQGKTIDEVAAYIQEHIQNFCHQFTVDDLNHLYRGGRVSRGTAILGTIAGIKPMLHVSPEGKLTAVGKVRGRKKSLHTLVETMGKTLGEYQNKNDIVFISHGDCLEDAEYVAALVKEQFGVKEIWIHNVCPTIGAHSGPGTVALFYMGGPRRNL